MTSAAQRLETTVIGSYPAWPDRKQLMRSYQSFMGGGIERDTNSESSDVYADTIDPYLKCLQEAVEAQVKAGIDTVSDGQTRDGMVELFVKNLGGTRLHGRAKILGDVEHIKPITLGDLEYARGLLPPQRRLKGLITGPYTLACSCRDEHYNSTQDAVFDIAEALNKEARAIQDVVDVIHVDEPFFTDDYPEYGKSALDKVFEGVEVETFLHVCGDVSRIFTDLAEYKVDVLAHEFANNPLLLDTVKEYDFPQRLCYGSVRSDSEEVETVESIISHVSRALEFFSQEKLLLSPDCGLRHQTPATAYRKLHNLALARNAIIGREMEE